MSIDGCPRRRTRGSLAGRGLVCAGIVLGSTTLGVATARAAPRADPPLVGAVRSSSGWTLRPLDPKTLQPLRGNWSRRVGGPQVLSLGRSPLGTGVVAAGSSGAIFLDSRTGAALRSPVRGDDTATSVYWLGGERFPPRGEARLLGAVTDSGSFATWADYFDITVDAGDSVLGGGVGYFPDFPWGAFPCGLIAPGDGEISLVQTTGRSAGNGIASKTLLPNAGAYGHYAGDVAHDRLYMLTDDGTIAEVDHVCGRPQIRYHHVALSGKPFQAAWAGRGQIELSGEDGLGTIDTRTWTAHALAADVQAALPTPYGIVVGSSAAGGISVYRPTGGRRFTALRGMTVDNQTAAWGPDPLLVSGRYLYVLAGGHRYTVDLTDGHVVGYARDDARLALPSYVPLP